MNEHEGEAEEGEIDPGDTGEGSGDGRLADIVDSAGGLVLGPAVVGVENDKSGGGRNTCVLISCTPHPSPCSSFPAEEALNTSLL